MFESLLLIPLVVGVVSFFLRQKDWLQFLLVAVGVLHSLGVLSLWHVAPPSTMGGWVAVDSAGLLFLSITSGLFLMVSFFTIGHLRGVDHHYSAAHQAVFVGCFLLFLSAMTLTCLSQHLGLLWVAIEATTLASAPLIYFHRSSRSLEATWKYLVICSVGIALALLGNFFLVLSASGSGPQASSLVLKDLLIAGPTLLTPWVKVAFVFFLVGFGTKMGLAPMHTWLPDAHSEAPSVVSAMLSGALLNNAFLGILRARQVCKAARLESFGQDSMIALGLLSMAFAAVFVLRQADYKRLLAYSSVEHMGILALGIGLGGGGVFASLYHAVNHSLAKCLLFLTAGRILDSFHTKRVAEVHGLKRVLPWTGFFWIAGFLAITGTPPFGTFVSEVLVAKEAFFGGRQIIGSIYLALLAVVFVGMAGPFIHMTYGNHPEKIVSKRQDESWFQMVPLTILLTAALIMGLYPPAPLLVLLQKAADLFRG